VLNLRTAKLEDVKRNLIDEEKRRQEKRVDTQSNNTKMYINVIIMKP
jgi:hypothetical protein